MARFSIVLFVALVGLCAVQGRELNNYDQYLKANSRTSAVAYSKRGTTSVKTAASAKAFYAVQNAVARAVATAVSKVYRGHKAKAVAIAAAQPIAKALAAVFVQTSSKAFVKGKGYGAGSAQASAAAYAEATAVAIAKAFSRSTNYKFHAQADALAIAISKALARAQAHLKTVIRVKSGGYVASHHTIIVKAFAKAIAHAFAVALASVESDYQRGGSHSASHAIADSKVRDDSKIIKKGFAKKNGNANVHVSGGISYDVSQLHGW